MTDEEMTVLRASIQNTLNETMSRDEWTLSNLYYELYNLDRNDYLEEETIDVGGGVLKTIGQIDSEIEEIVDRVCDKVKSCEEAFNGYMVV